LYPIPRARFKAPWFSISVSFVAKSSISLSDEFKFYSSKKLKTCT
jgi:hypothetical protein